MSSDQKAVYTVAILKDKLTCIDTSTGSTVGTFSYNGTVKSGPVITGDRCVVIFDTPSGPKGKIMRLPNFTTITTFNV